MSFVYQAPKDTCGEGDGTSIQQPHGCYWQEFPVLYSIDVIGEYTFTQDKPSDVFNAVRNCFEYVNELLGFEFFKYTDKPDNAKLKVAFGPLGGTLLGRCSYNYSKSSKKMNTSTILMDSSSRKWFINPKQDCDGGGSYFDIANTMTHEIGHAIGLAHNFGDKLATMYNKAARGTTYRRTFSKGEVELLQKIYSKYVGQSPAPEEPTPTQPTETDKLVNRIYQFLSEKFEDFPPTT